MADDQHYQKAIPIEGIPSSGPSFRLGCVGWVSFLFLSSMAVPFAILIAEKGTDEPAVIFLLLPVVIVWIVILVVIIASFRVKKAKPGGIDVLRDILNFDVGFPYRGVGITAFCRPDKLQPGELTAVLVFLQNYYSRPRQVKLKIGQHTVLGDLSGKTRYFELSPGQCAVYREVFQVPSDAKPVEAAISAAATIKYPEKAGVRLIKRSKKEPSLVLLQPRSVVFTIDVCRADVSINGYNESDSPELPQPGFYSLYYPRLKKPRFDILEQISNAPPAQPIVVSE